MIRDGKQVTFPRLNVEARQLPSGDGMSLRYGINLVTEPRSLGNVLSYSAKSAVNYARTVRLSLQMIFRGEVGLKEVTGPVGIVKTIADVGTQSRSVSVGIWNVLSLGAFIAINLGIMNLLPIPALDGGRIVGVLLTSGIEGVTKKKLNPKIEGYIHAGGMVLLLALMVLILFKDVIQILFEVCCAMIRQIQVGDVPVGGGAPVSIQSMLNTKTTDVEGSLRQLEALKAAGCQIARLAVPNEEAARGFREIAAQSPLPLVADIHFDYKLAIAAAEGGAAKIRINPATLAGKTGCRRWWRCARASTFPSGSGSTAAAWTKSSWRNTAIPRRKPWWRAPFLTWSFWRSRAFMTPVCP